jgi:hypothetical protein
MPQDCKILLACHDMPSNFRMIAVRGAVRAVGSDVEVDEDAGIGDDPVRSVAVNGGFEG